MWAFIGLVIVGSVVNIIGIETKKRKKNEQDEKRDAESKEKVIEEKMKNEKQRNEEKILLNQSQHLILEEFDENGNGIVDGIEGGDEFVKLLKKHQKNIIEIDRNYIQQFVKVSSYLETKKNNIQLMFKSIKETINQKELNQYVGILKNEIHTYNLILFSSLSMITSLVDDDMITFYEIHDSFDKLNMFNSNWENEVSEKLSNIGKSLKNLMYSIQEMSYRIESKLGGLTYATKELNHSVTNQLKSIDSSLSINTMLSSIQTYQMYKVNTNTKRLNN